MKDWQSQAHVKWECKYHVVLVPKYRRKELFGRLRRQIGAMLRELCRQKNLELLEGKAMPDHIHMLVSVPPKYSIAMTIGLEGKECDSNPPGAAGDKGNTVRTEFLGTWMSDPFYGTRTRDAARRGRDPKGTEDCDKQKTYDGLELTPFPSEIDPPRSPRRRSCGSNRPLRPRLLLACDMRGHRRRDNQQAIYMLAAEFR